MQSPDVKHTHILFETAQSGRIDAKPLRLRRSGVVFEVYNPSAVVRLSEVLKDFRILVQDVPWYQGRAVISSVVDSGAVLVCEASVEESGWQEVAESAQDLGKLRGSLADFLMEVDRDYNLLPEYKVAVMDMHSLLSYFKLWADQVELAWTRLSKEERPSREKAFAQGVAQVMIPRVNASFERFEEIVSRLPPEVVPAHRDFMRRVMHPLVLCAPFPHRAYYKPMGYAGDYEMVNMMARNTPDGASLFGMAVNACFLAQPPAEAHRNRIINLVQHLHNESVRVRARGRPMRVFNVACGPAEEIRRFLQADPVSSQAEFTLLDFSAETLDYTRAMLETQAQRSGRAARFEFVKKSVHQLIKESVRGARTAQSGQFDFVYCAGLFDYLTDEVCRRLMNLMYDWLAPGGLLLATNVEAGSPVRYGMEHLLDWHLVYRNGGDMLRIAPEAPGAEIQPTIEKTSFNVFLEVRKPAHV